MQHSSLFYVMVIVIASLLTSCIKTSSTNEIMEYQIINLMQGVEDDFNFNQLDEIMNAFSPLFLHKERDFNEEKYFWQNLLYQYTSLSIENISIRNQTDERIILSFDITFKYQSITQIYHEPSDDFGDLSYIVRENGEWKFIGKDEW